MTVPDMSISDKSDWGDGPWQNEPDYLHWIDELTGYICHVRRNPHTGALCGYVSVPEHHPYVKATNDELGQLHVHGGVTYNCENVIGFDCNHHNDLAPGMRAIFRQIDGAKSLYEASGQYRDIEFVKHQCAQLALQLMWQMTIDDEDPA